MIFKKNKKQIIDNSLILRLKGFTRICEKEPFNYKGERYELTIYEKENNSYLEKQYLKYTSKFDDFVRGYVLYNEIWIVIKNSNQDTTDKYFDKCDDFNIDKQKIVIRRESSLSLIEEEVKERNVKYMIKKYESGEIIEY